MDYMQERHKQIQLPIHKHRRLDAEVINARYIHDFKNKLDTSKFGK